MDKSANIALIFHMVAKLREKGNWTGETSIHKSLYILQKLMDVPIDYEFTLYIHGPFSFELRDELSRCIAYNYLDLEYVSPIYGPKYSLTQQAEQYLNIKSHLIDQYKQNVSEVCDIVSDKGVVSLEKLATALYVIKELHHTGEKAIQELNDLKPHISIDEASEAVRKMEELIQSHC